MGFGCKPSAALTHGPERLAPTVLLYRHMSLVNFISPSERRLQAGWKLNEVLGIKKVSSLYSSAYFYETPSLVGTCLTSRSVWLRLQGQCLGCPRERDLRSTGAEREQEMPQQQWWPAEEHLIFFRIAWLGTVAVSHISVTLPCLFRHRLCAEVWLESGKITILLGNLATHWKSHHWQLAFLYERVPANYIGSDKLVKRWRLIFSPGDSCLYLGKLSDTRMIHLQLQSSYSVLLQVKSNSCCWHEKQGRPAE